MGELIYEEATHEYKEGGVVLRSVTQIIKDAGLIDLNWIDKDLLAEKADLGNKVHKTTELYDMGSLNTEELHPALRSYLDGWIKFRSDYNFVPQDIELQLFHKTYRYAGRIDRTGLLLKELTLLDIKSGIAQKSNALQTAAYAELYNQDKKKSEQIKRRMIVYLSPDGYKIEEHLDANDKNVFLAALTISNFKRRK